MPSQEQLDLPTQSPEDRSHARQQVEEAERDRLIESQLNTEELLRGLGSVGIGRFKHPFRNLRAIFTATRRQMRGEYHPTLAEPQAPRDPFEDTIQTDFLDRLSQRRWERQQEAQRQLDIQEGRLSNPFED